MARLGGGGHNEYFTPGHIVSRARAALGGRIDFDPASCWSANQTVKATAYLTKQDDALRPGTPWQGPAVFVNPPYDGLQVRAFAERLLIELHSGLIDRAIWLSNANTGAVGAQMVLRASRAVCFLSGRLAFVDGRTGATAPRNRNDSMICALGSVDPALFDQMFRRLG